MLKCQKKGLCKALSMLLAAVMLMTAPIGTTQAYALENEPPTVTDSGLGTEEKSGSEQPTPPSSEEATPSDASLGSSSVQDSGTSPQQRAAVQAASTVDARFLATVGQCDINITLQGSEKFDATNANIVENWSVEDAGGNNLIIASILKTFDNAVVLTLQAPVPTVSLTLTAEESVFATGGVGKQTYAVTAKAPIPSEGTASAATGGNTITVMLTTGEFAMTQNKSGWTLGGAAASGNPITGTAYVGSKEATITLTNPIQAGDVYTLTAAQEAFAHTMIAPFAVPLAVTIQSVPVCAIGGTEYVTLGEALEAVKTGETIKLMANINYNDSITISKAVTFDVGQYTLNIIATKYDYLTGLEVTGSVSLISTTGELNVTGSRIGVMVRNGEAASATVTNATATQPDGIGIHATSVQPQTSGVVVKGNVNAPHTGVYAYGSGSTVTVLGNVNATGVGAEAESDANIVVYGGIEAESCGAKIVGTGRIIVQKDITTTGADSTGAWIKEAGSVRIDGDITAVNYIKLGSTIKHKGDGVADPDLSGYTKYTDGNDRVVRIKGMVVPSDKVCEIGGTQYATLDQAIAAAKSGEITAITLLQSITHHEPVVINGKSITFALGGFDLTIDTSGISNSTGLWVLGDGKVSCTGSGKLNVVGSDYGVRASGGSELYISGNVTARQYAVMAGSASGIGTPKVTVDGDVTVTGQDVNASSEVEAVSVGGYATVTIGGNVTANRTDETQSVTAVYSNASTIVVGKNVTTQGSGVNAQNGGKVTIGGALHYNPTGSGDQAYINVGYPVVSKTADDFEPTSIKPEYREYKNGDNVVWVKEAPPVCTIGAQKFTSLNAAIASVPAGGTATITLLQSITHTKHIRVEKKTINLDLGDHDLLLDTSADGSYAPALMVIDGGKLNLIGSGTGEFNIKSHMTAISAVGMNTKATVHNVVAGDSTGVNMVGSGDYFDSNSTVTVLGSITVGNENGVEVNAKNGKVVVGGNITAGRIGVYVWSNPGTQVTVNGDITVDGDSSIAGIWAYGATTVAVTGDVTVRGTNCVGVHASGSTIKVDGNVASSGKGAHSDTNGKVEITGSLTAGTPFIVVGTTEMTADQGTKIGEIITYTYDGNTVQIGSVGVPAPIYTITMQNDGHGTGSASPSSAEAGTEITLTATANGGYVFKEWQVISGGVTVSGNKFTMPAGNVTVKAIFEAASAPTYLVTINDGGSGATGAGSYEAGTTVNIYAGTRSNYTFTGWTSSDVAITNASNKSTSFTMQGKSVTVTANWMYNGGSSGGGSGGSSDSGSSTVITTTPEKKPNQPRTAAASVTATVGTNGTASANVPDKAITDAIAKAQADARAQGRMVNGIYISLYLTMPQGATSLSTMLSQNALQSLVNAGVSGLEINGAPVSIGLDLKALQEIQKQSSGNVTIPITPAQNLSSGARALIGTRPVYNITISYVKGGKTVNITSLGNGNATLSIPYVPRANEAAGYLFGVYVDGSGNATRIPGSAYDSGSRSVIFTTDHFSLYGVGYTAPSAKFTDTSTHWGKESIDYVVGRGLLSGTSKTTFAPNTAMTRGMLVTALGRLANVDTKAYTTNSFTDVKADSTFRPYIEWAYKKGIIQGTGNTQFEPDRAITREEIAVIFANYAKATGYTLPVTRNAAAYANVSSIGSAYKTAVTAMQQAGIMMGGTDNKFNPKTSATRAEVSSMLHRYVKLTIDPTTAQGWARNDAGQYLYYKDGKALTGTQTIDSVKYFFETNGTLKTGG